MKRYLTIVSIILASLSAVSCSHPEKMAEDAANIQIKCLPSPLIVKAGQINAKVTIGFPVDYFQPKAIMEVVPVLVYDGKEVELEKIMFQGERRKDNYRVVNSKGSRMVQNLAFPYEVGMEQMHIDLRFRCTFDKKTWMDLPTRRIAEGTNITETFVDNTGYYALKDSGYQAIIMLSPEGQVMYNLNSSEVQRSEYANESIKDLLSTINDVYEDSRKIIKGFDVVAYASPEGKEDFNAKLSTNRSKTADEAFDVITKDEELAGINKKVKSVGEDWEGFQEMVSKSDLEDKDLILRVLSMYSDPNVREKEIRNLASIYQDLAKEVLPQLRRARFIAHIEYTNYSEDELQELVKENIDILDEPAILKAAEIAHTDNDKISLYERAIEKFDSKIAVYNIACVYLDIKDVEKAKEYIAKCNKEDADVQNILGVIEMRANNWTKAKRIFDFIDNPTESTKRNLGLCSILEGNYSDAIIKCGSTGTDAALAHLLSNRLADALYCIEEDMSPRADYLRAIIYARKGELSEAREYLQMATDNDESLAARAAKDIEFAKLAE